MKTTDQKSEWTRARNLLAGMRSHSRRRWAGQILLGKVLLEIKQHAGLEGSGGDRRSKAQNELLKSSPLTWSELCRKELGISKPTADRYISRFKKAAEYAEALPGAGRILLVPTAALADDEVEALSAFVENLVEGMTQSALKIELGIEVEDDNEDEGDGNGTARAGDLQEQLEREAIVFFASIPRKIAALKKALCNKHTFAKYHLFLNKLPLDDGRAEKPSLNGIKKSLEAIRNGDLDEIIEDLEDAIKAKMQGPAPKVNGKNLKPAGNK